MLNAYRIESFVKVSGEDNERQTFKVGYSDHIKDRATGFKNVFLGGEPELMVVLNVLEGALHAGGEDLGEDFEEVFKKTESPVTIFVGGGLPSLQYEDNEPVKEEGRKVRHNFIEEETVT